MIIKKAGVQDRNQIKNLIQPYVEEHILLQRTQEQIINQIDQTYIAFEKKVIGVMNFVEYPRQLFEIRGLAIDKKFHGKGVGKKLINFATSDLIKVLIRKNHPQKNTQTKANHIRLFALTYVPNFFLSLDFHIVDKKIYPEKIFEDCLFCTKNNDCQEVALEKTIEIL